MAIRANDVIFTELKINNNNKDMGFKTDRMSAQDKTLNMFRKTIQASGSSAPNKPLSLADQLKQEQTIIKHVSNDDSEIEQRYNTTIYSEVRAGKK